MHLHGIVKEARGRLDIRLSQAEIYRFSYEANDETYLLKKVNSPHTDYYLICKLTDIILTIIGIAGAYRREKLVKINVKGIEDKFKDKNKSNFYYNKCHSM